MTKYAKDFTLRAADARGTVDHGIIKTAHSFSFGNYIDRAHMRFENLRVINDDWVGPCQGIGMHPHQNAEIFSYILEGALEHKDTMGNGSTVKAGGIQYMSAGSGVMHSEFNPSDNEPVEFLQIWLRPNVRNEAPTYDTLDIDPSEKDGQLKLFLSGDGRNNSMRVKADADIYAATLNGEQIIHHMMNPDCKAWIQIARGSLMVNGNRLKKGDGLAVNDSGTLTFSQGQDAEFLLFELG